MSSNRPTVAHLRSGLRQLAALGLCELVVIGTYSRLLFGGPLAGHDWKDVFHYYDWIKTSIVQYHTLPLYMRDAFHTPNYLANAQSPLLGPLVPLLTLMTTQSYIKLLIGLYLSVGLIGMFALLKSLGVEHLLAALISLLFVENGYFISHLCVGHHWCLGTLLLPLIILFYRNATAGKATHLWYAVVLNVLTIFEGQHHPYIWNNVFLALYAFAWAIQIRRLAPLTTWALITLASMGVGAVKLFPLAAQFASYAPQDRIGGIPPLALLYSLLVPGQTDQTQSSTIGFQFGAGWWEYSYYIGFVAFVLVVIGLLQSRGTWPVVVVGALFCVLSLSLSQWTWIPEPWSLVADFPIWKSQRAPSRFFINALTAFLVATGLGLQAVVSRIQSRVSLGGWLTLVLSAAIVLVGLDLFRAADRWERNVVRGVLPEKNHLFQSSVGYADVLLQQATPNRLVYTIEKPGPLIRLPMAALPENAGWHPIGFAAEVNDGLLAVRAPPELRQLVVVYRPPLFFHGIAASAVTMLTALVWQLYRFYYKRAPVCRPLTRPE